MVGDGQSCSIQSSQLHLSTFQHVKDSRWHSLDAHHVLFGKWQQFASLRYAAFDFFKRLMAVQDCLVDVLDLLLDFLSLRIFYLQVFCNWTPKRRLRMEVMGSISNCGKEKDWG